MASRAAKGKLKEELECNKIPASPTSSSGSLRNQSLKSPGSMRPQSPRFYRSPRTHTPQGGVVVQMAESQAMLNKAHADINCLTDRVHELEAAMVDKASFSTLKEEVNGMMKRMQNVLKEKSASDLKMQSWVQTRLETHKRQIKTLLSQDETKGKQLEAIEEQLAGMDFDIYALNGPDPGGGPDPRDELAA